MNQWQDNKINPNVTHAHIETYFHSYDLDKQYSISIIFHIEACTCSLSLTNIDHSYTPLHTSAGMARKQTPQTCTYSHIKQHTHTIYISKQADKYLYCCCFSLHYTAWISLLLYTVSVVFICLGINTAVYTWESMYIQTYLANITIKDPHMHTINKTRDNSFYTNMHTSTQPPPWNTYKTDICSLHSFLPTYY